MRRGRESNPRREPSWQRRWHGKSHPNALGEIWILIRRMCALVYVAESFQITKWLCRIDPAELVEIAGKIAAQQNFPRHRRRFGIHPGMHENGRRTVGCQCVVKARMLTDVINLVNIVEKDPADISQRRVCAVNIDVFLTLAISGADTNHVAL